MLDICLKGVRNFNGCVRDNSHSHLHDFMSQNPSLHALSQGPATPSSGSTFGAFMQLHKVLILLCICTLTRKFTFLRKGPKSLKDKLFCSFNEVFAFVEIFGF